MKVWLPRLVAIAIGLCATIATPSPLVAAGGSIHARTTDSAARRSTWVSTAGPEGGPVESLAVDPARPSTIFAGTWGSGVFKSVDGGRSWTAAGAGLPRDGPASIVVRLLVDPNSHGLVYALVGGGNGTLYRSRDGGRRWFAVGRRLAGRLLAVALDPSSSLLYGGGDDGIYVSRDDGASWRRPAQRPMGAVRVLAIAGRAVYAGGDRGLFKSLDRGRSWSLLAHAPSPIASLAVDPAAPRTLYAAGCNRLLISDDGGRSWRPSGRDDVADPGVCASYGFAFGVGPASAAYVSTDRGVFAIPRRGGEASSEHSAAPIVEKLHRPILAFAAGGGRLYAGTIGGVLQSSDAGRTWQTSNDGLVATVVLALAVRIGTPGSHVYAAGSGGIFRAGGPGRDRATGGRLLSGTIVDALAAAPGPGSPLYAAAPLLGQVFASDGDTGRWQARARGLDGAHVLSLAIDPGDPSRLYGGTDAGIVVSTDAGRSWHRSQIPQCAVRMMAIDPHDLSRLYAATSAGAYTSVDKGRHWHPSSVELPFAIDAILVDPTQRGTVYAAGELGVFMSRDAGITWGALGTRRPGSPVSALAFDPVSRSLFAATRNGVYSAGPERIWHRLGTGLANRDVAALAIEPRTRTLYAGTRGFGIFALALPTPKHALAGATRNGPSRSRSSFSTGAAASSGTRLVSKRNGYSIVLPGSSARWSAEYATADWTDTTIPGFGDPQLDMFQDHQTGRVYLLAARPATSLRAWTKFVASAQPSVCSAARALPASTLGGSPARILTWSCSDGYNVFVLTADHAHRGYLLLVASPTSLPRASDRSALDTVRRSFTFRHGVG